MSIKISVLRYLEKLWYEYVSVMDKEDHLLFMNYGISTPELFPIPLKEKDIKHLYHIQLYHRTIASVPVENKTIVEIGSGRGGGASFITEYMHPKSYTAIDRSSNGTKNAQKKFSQFSNLKFICGDAQALPMSSESFDIVLNVESSHCYPDFRLFVSEARRVLKSDGFFTIVDHRPVSAFADFENSIKGAGFVLREVEDITDYVILALQRDNERRKKLIDTKVPKFIRNRFYEFAALEGTNQVNRLLKTKEILYKRFVFQKI